MNTIAIPAGDSRCLDYCYALQQQGATVIGASSLGSDSSAVFYDHFEHLPWLGSQEFDSGVLQLHARFPHYRFYCPHPVLHDRLADLLPPGTLNELDHSDLSAIHHHAIRRRAGHYHTWLTAASPLTAQALTPVVVESLLWHFSRLDGQCSEEKFCALLLAASQLPQGDIIEIGSLFGKSAFVLGWLAQHFATGKLLVIDPWLEQRVQQPDVSQSLKKANMRRDFTSVHQRFIANLLPYLYGNINYLKMTSEEALPCYLSGDPVRSPELGETQFRGQISCLHIDGNHDYAHVTFDIEQWSSLLAPNAWLIIDDYRWAHGDGPRRAADEWLFTHRDRIGNSFFAGGALFIQLKNTG